MVLTHRARLLAVCTHARTHTYTRAHVHTQVSICRRLSSLSTLTGVFSRRKRQSLAWAHSSQAYTRLHGVRAKNMCEARIDKHGREHRKPVQLWCWHLIVKRVIIRYFIMKCVLFLHIFCYNLSFYHRYHAEFAELGSSLGVDEGHTHDRTCEELQHSL